MKKIKWLLVSFLFIFSSSLILNVEAEEITEEPIVEEATEEEIEFQLPDLTETGDEIKAWIAGILMSLASGGLLSIVGYIVLSRLKNKSIEAVNEAVNTNALSQKQADMAVNVIQSTTAKLEVKFNQLIYSIDEKMQGLASKIEGVEEKMSLINNAIEKFSEAIDTFLNEDEG